MVIFRRLRLPAGLDVIARVVLLIILSPFLMPKSAAAVWPMPPYTQYPCLTPSSPPENCQTQLTDYPAAHAQTRLSFRSPNSDCTPFSDPFGGFCFGGACTRFPYCRSPQIIGTPTARLVKVPTVPEDRGVIEFDVEYDFPNNYCQLDPRSDFTSSWWPILFNNQHFTRLQILTADGTTVLLESMAIFERGRWKPLLFTSCPPPVSFKVRVITLCLPLLIMTRDVTVDPPPASLPPCKPHKGTCPAPPGAPISAAKPINVGSGDVSYREPLFGLSQSPSSLGLELSYHSERDINPHLVSSPIGGGWTHTFAQTLRPVDLGEIHLYHKAADGQEFFYVRASLGVWNASWPGELRGQVTTVGSEYRLTDLDGRVTAFDVATGRWLSTRDRWGNSIGGTYVGSELTTVTDSVGRQVTLGYTAGKLTQITVDGNVWRLEYTDGRFTKLFDPLHAGVTPWRAFEYVNDSAGVQRLLSEVRDDANKLLEGHSYDAQNRGLTSIAEGGRDSVTVEYDVPAVDQRRVTHQIDGVTNQVSVFTVIYQAGAWLATVLDGSCSTCGGSDGERQTFLHDPSNHVLQRVVGRDLSGGGGTDERVRTDYTYNANGMVLTQTEAVGKPEQRTTTHAYERPSWPGFATSMTQPSAAKPGSNKVTTHAWNPTETVLTTSVSGFLASTDTLPTVHTTTTTFDSNHRVLSVAGPRAGLLTSMTYYSNTDANVNRRGRLATISVQTQDAPPISLTTTLDNYDIYGTARSVVDPNAVETQKTTDARGRVTVVTSKKPPTDPAEPADYTTTYAFDLRDRLTEVTLPRGNKLRYVYEDGTNRLTDTVRVDSSGNEQERLHLTLNLIGGKTQEEAQSCNTPAPACTAWTTKRSDSFTYDSHNRLSSIVHPDTPPTRIDYTYDSRGNLKDVKDERHTAAANTLYGYDFLNRLKTVTQKQILVPGPDVVTQYAYDVHDNLTSVTDPNGNVTGYQYDDFGRMRRQTSPVSGVTNSTHDETGNLLTVTDADTPPRVTTRTYDVANRVLTAASTRSGFPTETVTWTYDSAVATNYGKGRVATMTDPSGSVAYAYERRGLLRSEAKTIQGDSYSQAYGYDQSGNRASVTYPSGRVVTYTFDFADRPVSAISGGTTYVVGATYEPFGPQKTTSFGNGTTQTTTFDNRYRPTQNKLVKDVPLMTLAEYNYVEDGVGNISRIDDAQDVGFNRVFAYDDLNRLTAADSGASLWGTGSYGYDAMGNITSLALGSSRMATFTYSGTLPKLSQVTETGPGTRTVTYDAAGNETGVGPGTFAYSSRNYLSAGEGVDYVYDGRGLRTVASGEFSVPLSLASITLSPTTIVGGNPSTGTATLTGPAPMGGALVTLSSSNTAVATVPESVPVLQGLTSATFTVTTFAVATPTNVGITGVFVTTRTATLTVNPAGGVTLTVSPTSVPAGGSVTATWSGIPSPTTTDWIGLYTPPAADTDFLVFQYTDGSASGSMPFTIPLTTTPGTYELRLFSNDTFNRLATSNSFTVTEMGGFLGGEGSVLTAGGRPLREPVGRFASLLWGSKLGTGSLESVREGPGSLSETHWEEASCWELDLDGSQFDVSFLPTLKRFSTSVVSKRYFFYTPEMNLLAESELTSGAAPAILYEYIWFNGHPVAQAEGGTTTSWTFTDHLGTPVIQTNSAGAVSWRVEYEPYGRVFALRAGADQHQPLRLPGQEAEQFNLGENGLTERFYNVFRHYRYGWGRYTQSDPIGLAGGINLYAYALENPLTATDPYGLAVTLYCVIAGQGGNPIARAGGALGGKHCFVRVQCNCPKYDYRLEVTDRDNNTGLAVIPAPQNWFFGHGGSIVPFEPPDFDSDDCTMEDCVVGRYNRYRDSGYRYGDPITGPNSNTFAADLLISCGATNIHFPPGVPPFFTPPRWWPF